MRLTFVIPLALMFATPSFAQQQPQLDPAFLQRAIAALEDQRNTALTNEVTWRARYEVLADQLAKANARITELERAGKQESKP